LAALGFHEAVNQTMVPEPVAVENRSHARLQNPLTSEMSALRGSLLPGLLANLRTNVSRHQFDVRLFEIGRVFAADGKESLNLALAMTGRRDPESWETATRGAKLDFYDLKGALEELARQFGIPGFAALEIKQISAAAAKKLDLRDEVVTAETDLNALLASAEAEKQFVELPKFPAVVRDMALVVDEAVPHGAIVAAIEGNRNKFLEKIELFDIFRGSSIPSGKKSLAYSLTFRAADRTLTDVEVNAAHEQLKRQLQQQLQCEIRES
jgi:phenylalanyl-tRNA synthetase beta chain